MKLQRAVAVCFGTSLMLIDSVAGLPVEVSIPSPVDGSLEATVYLEELSEQFPVTLRTKTVLGEVTLPWQGVVDVEKNTRRRLEVRGPGLWCTTGELETDDQGEALEPASCRMVPAGIISGRLRASPKPDSPPGFLRLTSQSTKVKENESEPEAAAKVRDFVFCAVNGGEFTCPLPAGTLDLRLDLEGYGAQFLWRQGIIAGTEKKLGRLSFEKGASIAGAVVGRGLADGPDVIVELRPRLAARDAHQSQQRALDLRKVTTPVDQDGRFGFLGVDPGEYVLIAAAADFCVAESRVRVGVGDSLVHIQDPIVLDACARLEAFIEPASDFSGEGWSLELHKGDVGGSSASVGRSEAVGLDGAAVVAELEAGVYDLEIRDHEGDAWWRQNIDVYAGMSPVFIEIGAVRVHGRAFQGTEPIAGELNFGTRNASPSVSMAIDEEGSFEGNLPFDGQWALELDRDGQRQFLDAVTVEVPSGKTYAEVEVLLPDTLVAGKVVEGGEAVEGAIVVVLRNVEGRLEKELFDKSDEGGEFLFSGVRPGTIQLRAAIGRLTSEWRILAIEEGDELEDLELELAATIEVQGQVSAHGRGIPGARIIGFPAKSAGNLLATNGATGADGSFDVKVSRDAERLDLAVFTPGHEVLLALARPVARGADWPVIAVQLQGVGGVVVLQTDDPSLSGSVSFGGAVLPLRTFWNLMAQEERVDQEQYRGVSFHGLAAGAWTFCRPGVQGHCVTEDLLPGEVAIVRFYERTSE